MACARKLIKKTARGMDEQLGWMEEEEVKRPRWMEEDGRGGGSRPAGQLQLLLAAGRKEGEDRCRRRRRPTN
jgi:hypothetical protein